LLRDAGVPLPSPATDLGGGRLLLFAPEDSLSDGAAAVHSRLFFDGDNEPPWDSWVHHVADPLTPDQQAAEEARGTRTGRWSHVRPNTAFPWWEAPYYRISPPHPTSRATYLVSWVPPAVIPLAHAGICANPEGCIEWLTDRDTPFTRALQEFHLLL
jgi:hypothetical protein